MEKTYSRCTRCGNVTDVPYMLICPRCGGDMHTIVVNTQQQENIKKFGIFSAYAAMFRKAFDFRTRSRRSEYWYASLMDLIINFILIVIFFASNYVAAGNAKQYAQWADKCEIICDVMFYIITVYSFVTFVPKLSLTVRRLHDSGKPAILAALSLFPYFSIVLLYFMTQDSVPGYNMYGPNPKGIQ